MKKVPNSEFDIPKDIKDFIKQQAKFQKQYAKHLEQINDLHKRYIGLDKRSKEQMAEGRRIAKELSVANHIVKEQQEEINRLQRNLGDFLS